MEKGTWSDYFLCERLTARNPGKKAIENSYAASPLIKKHYELMEDNRPESVKRAFAEWHREENPFIKRHEWSVWDIRDAYLDTPLISPDRIPPGHCQYWDPQDKCYVIMRDPWTSDDIMITYQARLMKKNMDETEVVVPQEEEVVEEAVEESPELEAA
jgi:hypothetical protein